MFSLCGALKCPWVRGTSADALCSFPVSTVKPGEKLPLYSRTDRVCWLTLRSCLTPLLSSLFYCADDVAFSLPFVAKSCCLLYVKICFSAPQRKNRNFSKPWIMNLAAAARLFSDIVCLVQTLTHSPLASMVTICPNPHADPPHACCGWLV